MSTENTAVRDALEKALHNEAEGDTPDTDALAMSDVALTIPGTAMSIVFHDEALANDSFLITALLQGLADRVQRSRIKAEDIISSMEDQLQRNLEENNVDEAGEVQGLSPNQEILMDKLEDQLDVLQDVMRDLQIAWDKHNDNPEFKLLYMTDTERRQRSREFQAEQAQEKLAEQREAIKQHKELREKRRAARRAKMQ